eukprot:TRINITY_DN5006_c0_g1_i1.p1 TRINITY_DN5006_c0_g1~~TRINITY_DN5006_c0_g1_i1.p1  ORF type:complete len:965 (-),score=238.04 TRINITY_DN5006_c0_g1_i1:219-3113(-)
MSSFMPLAADAIATSILGTDASTGVKEMSPIAARLVESACKCAAATVSAELRARTPNISHAPLTTFATTAGSGSAVLAADIDLRKAVEGLVESQGMAENLQQGQDRPTSEQVVCSPSQATAAQLRIVRHAYEDARAESIRLQAHERLAIKLEEEALCRTELRRRKLALEADHQRRVESLAAGQKAATERLAAREEEARRRWEAWRMDLSKESADLELRKREERRKAEAESERLELSWSQLRAEEKMVAEAEATVKAESDRLRQNAVESEEAAASFLAQSQRSAASEMQCLVAQKSHLKSEVAEFSDHQSQYHTVLQRLEGAEHAASLLRKELAQAREDSLAQLRDLSEVRRNLDLLKGELHGARLSSEQAHTSAEAARKVASAASEAEAHAKGELLRQQLALRDSENLLTMRLDSSERRIKILTGELASERSRSQSREQSKQRYESALHKKVADLWRPECLRLETEIQELRHAREVDAKTIFNLKLQMAEQIREKKDIEEGWWQWLHSIRSRLPSDLAPRSNLGWKPTSSRNDCDGDQHCRQELPAASDTSLPARPQLASLQLLPSATQGLLSESSPPPTLLPTIKSTIAAATTSAPLAASLGSQAAVPSQPEAPLATCTAAGSTLAQATLPSPASAPVPSESLPSQPDATSTLPSIESELALAKSVASLVPTTATHPEAIASAAAAVATSSSSSSSSASASPLPDTMAVEPSASATSAKASLPVPPAALAASEPAPVVAMLPSPVSDKSMSAKAFNTSATAEAAATTAVTSQPLLEQMEKSLLGSECCRDELLRSVDGQGDGDDICSFSSLPLPESLEAKRSNATMGLSAAGTISESKKQQGPSTKEACSEEELAPEEVCNFSEPSSAASSAHRMEQGRESVENLEAPAKIGQTLEASNIQDSEVEEFAGNDQDDEDVLSPLASPLRQPGAGDGATTNADSTNQRGAWWSGSMSSFEESADIL